MDMLRRRAFLSTACLAVLLTASPLGAAEEKTLNVFNWSDYVAADTLERFERETGIKVNYDVYDSNQMLEAKLLAGSSGYDVVFPSLSPFFAQQLRSGIYRPLDKAKLTNLSGLDANIMRTIAAFDSGNVTAVPYMWAATGIGYNVDKVRAILGQDPDPSWSLLLDPAIASRLAACGLTLIDDPIEAVPAALAFAGDDPVRQDEAGLDAAMAVLGKIRPNLKYIHSSSYINDLANGDICVAHGYVGDLIQARERAREANNGVTVQVFIPREGAVTNVDVMAIPKDAPHPENAHRFIDFMMRPDVVAPISSETGYANAVPAAMANVDEAIRTDPAIFPPDEVLAKTFSVPPADRGYERARTRAWTRFKSGL
jgi:putrescine transport system substrate-binding protein